MLKKRVLVLNNAYEPIGFTTVKSVLKKIVGGSSDIYVERYYDEIFHTVSRSFKVPSVIRISIYVSLKKLSKAAFSRREIYERDNHTCGYCAQRLTADKLTMDHIIPKAQGGSNEYSNLVTCCYRCNNLKGARSPEQAKMPLQYKIPKQYSPVLAYIRRYGLSHKDWSLYLYGD